MAIVSKEKWIEHSHCSKLAATDELSLTQWFFYYYCFGCRSIFLRLASYMLTFYLHRAWPMARHHHPAHTLRKTEWTMKWAPYSNGVCGPCAILNSRTPVFGSCSTGGCGECDRPKYEHEFGHACSKCASKCRYYYIHDEKGKIPDAHNDSSFFFLLLSLFVFLFFSFFLGQIFQSAE